MPLSLYETQLLAARLQLLELIATDFQLLDQIMINAYNDIDRELALMADSTDMIRKTRLENVRAVLSDRIADAFDEINDVLDHGMRTAAELARDGHVNASLVLFENSPEYARGVPPIFAAIPDDALRAVLARAYDDGLTFSQRIWDLEQFSEREITKTVAKGLVEGKSHYELMRDLEPFLKMTDEEYKAFQRTWAETHDEQWQSDWKTRGRMKYNLRRLARTELNNAYREGTIYSARLSPWVQGLKWNLSASHPKVDICDTWASQDLYGMGEGVYPFDAVPIDHPNGLCYLTQVLKSDNELAQIVRSRRAA